MGLLATKNGIQNHCKHFDDLDLNAIAGNGLQHEKESPTRRFKTIICFSGIFYHKIVFRGCMGLLGG